MVHGTFTRRRMLVTLVCGGLCVFAIVLWSTSQRVDTFVLADAALVDPRFPASPEQGLDVSVPMEQRLFAVRAHRLRRGRGTIYAYRVFDRGEWSTIDDETYRKRTLWTAAPMTTRETLWHFGDERRVVALYTEGGSAWPQRACAGALVRGTLRVRPRWRGVRVDVHGRMGPPCADREIALSFDAQPLTFDALTPWLGLPAEHPYAETYR